MKLITSDIKKKLEKNYENEDHENIPLKLFNAFGSQTWLITQLEPDGDTMLGFADLGFGCVEYGIISLNELKSIPESWRFKLERDKNWTGGEVKDYFNKSNLAGV